MEKLRIRFIATVFLIFWFVLLVKIYYLSIKSNDYYEEISLKNAVKTESIAPIRGSIKDRNFEPLSINKLGFAVELRPHLRLKASQALLEEKINLICSVLGDCKPEELKKEYLKLDSPYGHEFVRIIDFVPYDKMIPHFAIFHFDEHIKIVPSAKRHYPANEIASHIIGYVGKADAKNMEENPVSKLAGYIGKSGIEYYYNDILQGVSGSRKIKVTAKNEEVGELEKIPPKSSDVVLTIDLGLQKFISSLFADSNNTGSAVVMDIYTGQILAAGSYPEYDINKFVNGISHEDWEELSNDPDRPFANKIIKGLYPPGSTIKMGVGLSFMENGLNENFSVFCESNFELGGRKFRCWKEHGHGSVNLRRAIRESCDDYFYKGSLKVGMDDISTTLKLLGFGQKTGVDLIGEFDGIVPSKDWKMQKFSKPWYIGETLNSSIGQGYFLATPIQMAVYTATLATGKKPIPHFIKSIGNEEVGMEPRDVLNNFQKSKLKFLQEAMYDVCNAPGGTAKNYIDTRFEIAGKTGTSQVVGIAQNIKKRVKEGDMKRFERSHAWLTTYGPYKNPQYAVVVLVEHGGHGGSAAGPIVSKIYNKLLELEYISLK